MSDHDDRLASRLYRHVQLATIPSIVADSGDASYPPCIIHHPLSTSSSSSCVTLPMVESLPSSLPQWTRMRWSHEYIHNRRSYRQYPTGAAPPSGSITVADRIACTYGDGTTSMDIIAVATTTVGDASSSSAAHLGYHPSVQSSVQSQLADVLPSLLRSSRTCDNGDILIMFEHLIGKHIESYLGLWSPMCAYTAAIDRCSCPSSSLSPSPTEGKYGDGDAATRRPQQQRQPRCCGTLRWVTADPVLELVDYHTPLIEVSRWWPPHHRGDATESQLTQQLLRVTDGTICQLSYHDAITRQPTVINDLGEVQFLYDDHYQPSHDMKVHSGVSSSPSSSYGCMNRIAVCLPDHITALIYNVDDVIRVHDSSSSSSATSVYPIRMIRFNDIPTSPEDDNRDEFDVIATTWYFPGTAYWLHQLNDDIRLYRENDSDSGNGNGTAMHRYCYQASMVRQWTQMSHSIIDVVKQRFCLVEMVPIINSGNGGHDGDGNGDDGGDEDGGAKHDELGGIVTLYALDDHHDDEAKYKGVSLGMLGSGNIEFLGASPYLVYQSLLTSHDVHGDTTTVSSSSSDSVHGLTIIDTRVTLAPAPTPALLSSSPMVSQWRAPYNVDEFRVLRPLPYHRAQLCRYIIPACAHYLPIELLTFVIVYLLDS